MCRGARFACIPTLHHLATGIAARNIRDFRLRMRSLVFCTPPGLHSYPAPPCYRNCRSQLTGLSSTYEATSVLYASRPLKHPSLPWSWTSITDLLLSSMGPMAPMTLRSTNPRTGFKRVETVRSRWKGLHQHQHIRVSIQDIRARADAIGCPDRNRRVSEHRKPGQPVSDCLVTKYYLPAIHFDCGDGELCVQGNTFLGNSLDAVCLA